MDAIDQILAKFDTTVDELNRDPTEEKAECACLGARRVWTALYEGHLLKREGMIDCAAKAYDSLDRCTRGLEKVMSSYKSTYLAELKHKMALVAAVQRDDSLGIKDELLYRSRT